MAASASRLRPAVLHLICEAGRYLQCNLIPIYPTSKVSAGHWLLAMHTGNSVGQLLLAVGGGCAIDSLAICLIELMLCGPRLLASLGAWVECKGCTVQKRR